MRREAFNPNPHCFKAITKLTALGSKESLLTYPLHSTVEGAGGGGAFSAALKISLNKNVNCTHFFIKGSLKMTFLWKSPETKKFAELFRFAVYNAHAQPTYTVCSTVTCIL
jgi:hypothetical protein